MKTDDASAERPIARDEQRVLLLAPVGRDAELTRSILRQTGIEADACRDLPMLCRELAKGAGAVLVAEEVLTPDQLVAFAAVLDRQPPWSDVPVVVVTNGEPNQAATLATLARIEPLRNVTLVDRPVRLITLTRAISVALRARRRQYELRDLLARLEGAVRQRDEFLAMLGHELRNPLTAIAYAVHMLESEHSADARGARQRAILARQSGHLTRLVDDLLDVARVTSGKISLCRNLLDLGELARRSIQSLEADAAQRGVALDLHEPPTRICVHGDAVRLEQVLSNVLTNGIKYTPNGGRVDVLLETSGREAIVRVRDTGVGIAPNVLPTIFDLFKQADGTLDRSRGGLGIGLTLVRSLVELHGGSVSAASGGIGLGSEFVIRLPSANGAPAAANAVSSDGCNRARRALHRLLVVEDNEDVRTALLEMLESAGHSVEAVADGATAVARALAAPPEAMLVDIGLPGYNGYEVARRIRSALGSRVRLVAITGYGQPDDRRRALESGFDAHITKPASLDVVERALRDLAIDPPACSP